MSSIAPTSSRYLLYPDRDLPGFLEKNNVPAARVAGLELVAALIAAGDTRLLVADETGALHFNGDFTTPATRPACSTILAGEPAFAGPAERPNERRSWPSSRKLFDHAAFTGRSGTFFAYEGLGSIYWHMVAKLLLAVEECHTAAHAAGAAQTAALGAAYYDIRQGLGFNKTPAEYGAFPTDPYSHTPASGGARQPGMTGLVKEEILARWGELGVRLRQGTLHFDPVLLQPAELLDAAAQFEYVDVHGRPQTVPLPAASLAFTVCQTPVVYQAGAAPSVTIHWSDGRIETHSGKALSPAVSRHIFDRDGQVRLLHIAISLTQP